MFPRYVRLAVIWNIPFVLNVFPIVWELLFLPLATLQKADHLCQNLKDKLKQGISLFAYTVGQQNYSILIFDYILLHPEKNPKLGHRKKCVLKQYATKSSQSTSNTFNLQQNSSFSFTFTLTHITNFTCWIILLQSHFFWFWFFS